MSSVKKLKAATAELPLDEQWELYRWLSETAGVRHFRLQELRREIAAGIEQVESGDVAPLDVSALKEEVRRRSKG